MVCRTWSSKHTQNNTLCLPISKDYKTRPSRSHKHLLIYTYPYNGLLKVIHVPVFLKLERKLPTSEEICMVFQAGWSNHSNSSHSMTQSLHLYPETTVWTVLGMHIATLAYSLLLVCALQLVSPWNPSRRKYFLFQPCSLCWEQIKSSSPNSESFTVLIWSKISKSVNG